MNPLCKKNFANWVTNGASQLSIAAQASAASRTGIRRNSKWQKAQAAAGFYNLQSDEFANILLGTGAAMERVGQSRPTTRRVVVNGPRCRRTANGVRPLAGREPPGALWLSGAHRRETRERRRGRSPEPRCLDQRAVDLRFPSACQTSRIF